MTEIAARRAAVRPRVHVSGSNVTHLLEDVVRETLRTHFEGVIEIIGGAGMGKTTALEHLREVLTDEEQRNLLLFDEPHYDEIRDLSPGKILICTQRGTLMQEAILSVILTGWSEDDAIEYLLSKHHDMCGSVMSRLDKSKENQIEYHLLVGCPETIAIVLDRMAQSESMISVKQCIREELSELIPDEKLRKLCGEYCLASHLEVPVRGHKSWKKLQKNPTWKALNEQTGNRLQKRLRHKYIQRLLAAEEVIREISNNEICLLRNPKEHIHLVFEAAKLIEPDSPAEQNLKGLLSSSTLKIFGDYKLHALAASLLNAAGRGWRPVREPIPNLRGAILHGIQLAEENLCSFDFSGAVLCDADLRNAQLVRTQFVKANLADANLSNARMHYIKADKADLQRTNLKNVVGPCSSWSDANLISANLEGAQLDNAWFDGADLSKTDFTKAQLRGANFQRAKIEEAIFEGVDFTSANLSGLELNQSHLSGACFESADLSGCHLEGVNLPGANFQNANLTNTYWTDSILPGANFQNAILRGAGLAGIEWEGANLNGTDLRESTFHMGSSRSGLVDSFLASEGTRTGFYTDDYEEQYFKSPEEIRKANLRGADLRGANITGVDFYLVDLRDAQIDDDQRAQLETTGAILFDRD